MQVEAKAPRNGNVFEMVQRLKLVARSEAELQTLADLHRIFVAGSTTRLAFTQIVHEFRYKIDEQRPAREDERG